jgi:hypothetical protein
VSAPDHLHPIERATKHVEWLPVGLEHQLFEVFTWSKLTNAEDRRAGGPDHLQRAFLPRQKSDPQGFLPIDDALKRNFALLGCDRPLDLNDSTNVVRWIGHGHR